jgi:hypothetical protein
VGSIWQVRSQSERILEHTYREEMGLLWPGYAGGGAAEVGSRGAVIGWGAPCDHYPGTRKRCAERLYRCTLERNMKPNNDLEDFANVESEPLKAPARHARAHFGLTL